MNWTRPLTLSVAGIVVTGCLTGCAITRKSASIDSTSRMPWFGLELAPRRNEPAPETRRIKQDRSAPARVEPAKLLANGSPQETKWWQRLTGTEKRPAIFLPRTDLVETPPKSAAPVTVEALTQANPEF